MAYKTITDSTGKVIYSEGIGTEDTLLEEGYTVHTTYEPALLNETDEGFCYLEPIKEIH